MRIERTVPRSGLARRTGLIALVSGFVAAAAFAAPTPTVSASDAPTFSANQLTKASDSVLKAGIPGTAWAVTSARR